MLKEIKSLIILILWDIIYLISYCIPKDENLWVFGAWFGEKYADNSKYLFEYVNDKHPDIKAVWLTKSYDTLNLINKKGYEAYMMNSLRGYKLCFRASKGILSTGIYDLIPCACGRMKIIQLWHGTPLKKIVFDEEVTANESKLLINKLISLIFPYDRRKEFNKNNMYISTSDEVKNKLSSAFRVPKQNVKITGYPRNDFSDSSAETPIKQRILKLKDEGKKIGIYMPTHRKSGQHNSTNLLVGNIEYINSLLKNINTVLLVKVHFYGLDTETIHAYQPDRIIFLKDEDFEQDIYKIIPLTDYLITDYSSVYFDYLLLNKPIIFAPFDIDDYLAEDRKFYYDYEKVTPGPKAKNWDEVITCIEESMNHPNKYKEDRDKINRIFNEYEDKENCQRVYEKIIERF